MARSDTTHSRFVAAAKLVLPLLSLGLLATLFLFARGQPYEMSIPFARVDLETLAREKRLDGPAFSTVTTDGAEIYLSADKVRPDLSDPDVVNSTAISGSVNLPDGSALTLEATRAVIDGPSRIAELAGDVLMTSSAGYIVSTDSIAAMLDVSRIESSGQVSATGPLGSLDAGHMVVSKDPETDTYLLVFKDGVKLVYQPKD
ncbi:hypothetical protein [Celeribacter sp.]|uniref:hypothetical protein n=1 Tax=Celeribacter sp. TaxID=1890673 RepID=UPI003A8DE053